MPTRRCNVLAATVVAAGAVSLASVPAVAVTPAPEHCSAWAKVGTTKYEVRVCGTLTTHKKSRHVLESVLLKNTGRQNVAVSGSYGVGWGQAGNGTGFTGVKVGPGKSKTITDKFAVGTGPYTITATLTVGKVSATAHQKFTK